jgi:hypothetical protein
LCFRRVKDELASRYVVTRGEALAIDGERDRPHAVGREPVALDQRAAGVLGNGDHDPGAADRPAVDDLPVGTLATAEELRVLLVQKVEDARYRERAVDPRQHHAEREVDRVEPVELELAPQRAWMKRRQRYRPDPVRHAARGAIARDDRRREPVGRVGGDGRHVDAVTELADAVKCAAELAHVRLRAAAQPRDEREKADADHARDPR